MCPFTGRLRFGNHLPFSCITPLYFLVERPFNGCRRQAVTQIEGTRDGRWIMVGAGSLPEYRFLNDKVQWHMIEPSHSMAKKGERRSLKRGLKATWCLQKWEDYLSDGEVDGVYFSFILGIHPNPESALNKAWNLLKPGGVLLVLDLGLEKKGRWGPAILGKAFSYLVSRPAWSLKAWMAAHGTSKFESCGMGSGIWKSTKPNIESVANKPKENG